ncbi:site-specific integrase [Sporosarcina psychrophila]|uniref:tyrosine-type recombinase/integrase n=1 Tax=Sporosarcina psychrophila TaxID=1476 RepID=UPI0030D0D6AA
MRGGLRKRGNNWYYYFELGLIDGNRQKLERVVGPDKKDAERALRIAISEYENTGRHFDPSTITVADFMDYWIKEYAELNLKHNTIICYERAIKLQIKPVLGKYRLRSLTPAILQSFTNDLFRQGYAKQSLSIFTSILNNALKHAVYPWGYIKENPMQYVMLPKYDARKATEKDLKILTVDCIRRISEYLTEGHPLAIPFQLGLHTGLRVSEVCGLIWENIDLDRGTLSVRQAMINQKGKWIIGTTKTVSSERLIHLGPSIINILKKHRIQLLKNKLKYGVHYIESENVCVKECGSIITPSVIKYNTRKMKDELEIEFNFHSLRHTHATMLMENGAKVKDIQARLGHSRSAITIDTYSHLTQKMKDETIDIFEQAMRDIK